MSGVGSSGVQPARRLLVLCCNCRSRDAYGLPLTNESTNVEVAVAEEAWEQVAQVVDGDAQLSTRARGTEVFKANSCPSWRCPPDMKGC